MSDNLDVARRALNVFNTGDYEALDQLVSATAVAHDAQNPFAGFQGPDAYRPLVKMYRDAFPDLVMTIDASYDDDDAVILRWTTAGTHTGGLPFVPATGRHGSVTGISIYRIENGMVAETWTNWDTLGMLQQLGAVPEPDAAHQPAPAA